MFTEKLKTKVPLVNISTGEDHEGYRITLRRSNDKAWVVKERSLTIKIEMDCLQIGNLPSEMINEEVQRLGLICPAEGIPGKASETVEEGPREVLKSTEDVPAEDIPAEDVPAEDVPAEDEYANKTKTEEAKFIELFNS